MLSIRDLHVAFVGERAAIPVVDHVSLTVAPGQTVALLGESGCGKSLTSLAILRLVPPPGRIVGGRIEFDGRDLLACSQREIRAIRGARIGMVFQEPMTSLNPVLRIGEQIAEATRVHLGHSRRAAHRHAVELLDRVGIPDPLRRAADYPHQLSGGMRQRVLIAMAIACRPSLLIADEPTTALDVTIQRQILELLRALQRDAQMGMLLVTHDLAVVGEFADEAYVMYAGRIVERSPAADLLLAPRHPYTQALLRSIPAAVPVTPPSNVRARTSGPPRSARKLPWIPGEVPRPGSRPTGCAFHPRCDRGDDPRCRGETPTLERLAPGRDCACWKATG